MEKTAQNLLNEKVAKILGELTGGMQDAFKSKEIMTELIQFEGKRIDSLENKIDILMTERGKAIIDWDSDLFKDEEEDIPVQLEDESFLSEKMVGGKEAYVPLEEIHFDGYHFEVETTDESDGMNWNEAMNFNAYDEDGWRLPTIDELRLMYLSRERLGMSDKSYWSSSESSYDYARGVFFYDGYPHDGNKDNSLRVRLVRTIKDE